MTIPRASIRRKHQPQVLSCLERKELGAHIQSKRPSPHSIPECPDLQKIKNTLPKHTRKEYVAHQQKKNSSIYREDRGKL